MKDRAPTELMAAVRRVAAGKSYVSEETAERILLTLGAGRRAVGLADHGAEAADGLADAGRAAPPGAGARRGGGEGMEDDRGGGGGVSIRLRPAVRNVGVQSWVSIHAVATGSVAPVR